MPALYIMIPVAVILVACAIWLYFWAIDSGQYDDLDSPAHSILFDDDDPLHQAGMNKARARRKSSTSKDSSEHQDG